MKKWIPRILRSKTMRFNLSMAMVTALEANFKILEPYLPGNVYAYLTVILIVGGTYYRTVTSTALKDK